MALIYDGALRQQTRAHARVEIDPNVRVAGNLGRVRLVNVGGGVAVGQEIVAYESESGVEWSATVVHIDTDRGFAYLNVDWSSLRDTEPEPEPDAGSGQEYVVIASFPFIGFPDIKAMNGNVDAHLLEVGVGDGQSNCECCSGWINHHVVGVSTSHRLGPMHHGYIGAARL